MTRQRFGCNGSWRSNISDRICGGSPGRSSSTAFSDCRTTMRGREGDIIDGRYRLVRIGIESVVMEYPDGRGRTTIRMSGQECVTK